MSTIRVVNLQHTDATVPNIVLESDGTSVFASGITISGATTLTVSGTAEFASGTAAAPKITFIDDNDTGIYSPAANNLGITTNGTAALTIDASQQVGIGTTSPQDALHIAVPSAVLRLEDTDTNHISTIQSTAAALVLSADATDSVASSYLGLSVDGSERLRIDNSGNVGVGTTSPSRKLVVSKAGAEGIEFGPGESSNVNLSLHFNRTSNTYITNEVRAAVHTFYIGSSEKVRIDSSGNVGIGTTGPGTKLEVGGSAALRTDADVRLTLGSAGSIGSNDSNFIRAATDQVIYNSATASGRHSFELAGVEKMRINSSGNVGIGTTSPSGVIHIKADTDDTTLPSIVLEDSGTTATRLGSITNRTGDMHLAATASLTDIRSSIVLSDSRVITFNTGNSERLRILNGDGITFNGDTAAANALDDYEEGTWTPTTNTGTITYAKAIYTKIGRQVTLYAECTTFSNRTDTDRVEINGLPFTATNSGSAVGSAMWRYVDAQAHTVYLEGDGLYFYQSTSGNWESLNYNELNASNSSVYFVATYMT